MSFAAAGENLTEAARHGIDACLYWPGLGVVPATELDVAAAAAAGPRGPDPVGSGAP